MESSTAKTPSECRSLSPATRPSPIDYLAAHWQEYLIEAAGLGLFMISACLFAMILEYPDSPLRHMLVNPWLRRVLMGVAMCLTAIAIIYSPWGRQSGAHLNPAVTLTFLRLGKIAPWDAFFYVVAQFLGGVAGVGLVAWVAGGIIAHPSVNYVATQPGAGGPGAAFLAEAGISFILMTVVLTASNMPRMARFAGLFAGTCVGMFIVFVAPISGMSINPARTFASALLPGLWASIWIYFIAPPLGMLAAGAAFGHFKKPAACAKLQHVRGERCIFCRYQAGTL